MTKISARAAPLAKATKENAVALPPLKPVSPRSRARGLRGEMVLAANVASEWSAVLWTVRAGLLAVPNRCAALLPHLTAHDVAEIDREVCAVLIEIGEDRCELQ